jgi:hypothetical protein
MFIVLTVHAPHSQRSVIFKSCHLIWTMNSHIFSHGSTAQRGLLYEVPGSRSDTPHSVGLLWTSDRPIAETSTDNTHHSQETHIHAPGRIRTRNPSKRAAADPRLRQRGHRDRLTPNITDINTAKCPARTETNTRRAIFWKGISRSLLHGTSVSQKPAAFIFTVVF